VEFVREKESRGGMKEWEFGWQAKWRKGWFDVPETSGQKTWLERKGIDCKQEGRNWRCLRKLNRLNKPIYDINKVFRSFAILLEIASYEQGTVDPIHTILMQ